MHSRCVMLYGCYLIIAIHNSVISVSNLKKAILSSIALPHHRIFYNVILNLIMFLTAGYTWDVGFMQILQSWNLSI